MGASKIKVLALTKYSRKGASSRLRTFQYLPFLLSNDVDIQVSSLFDDLYLTDLYKKRNRKKLAIIKSYIKRMVVVCFTKNVGLYWIEKELFPYLPYFFEKILTLRGIPYIVDYDDAIFHNYEFSGNWFVKKFMKSKIDHIMHFADCVLVGNSYLERRAIEAKAKIVEVIPTVVDFRRYSAAPKINKKTLTIGWIGSPTSQYNLLTIGSALEEVCKLFGCKVLIIGGNKELWPKSIIGHLEFQPWSEQSEVSLIHRIDIGIMPLNDEGWERGKCGYKLIQYMACGIPVIASPVGINIEIVDSWKCGILARTKKEWIDGLATMLRCSKLRSEFGRMGRGAVETKFSMQRQEAKLLSIIKSYEKSLSKVESQRGGALE